MPFDDRTRSRLARFVSDARELMAKEFAAQFQMTYGLSSTGEISPLEVLQDLDESQRSTATLLRERVDYLRAGSSEERSSAAAAIERLAREQAFTVINRLAAIRMAEKRGLILESVGRGYQSKGFQVYAQVAGNALGDAYNRYRNYLYCLFDELAVDLGALFERRSPFGLLFPGETALLEFFDLLNAHELEPLWAEDETIGWIYQYYNDDAERRRMREQSAAPRSSRELAVRNQFFTPRYVVEFLTDNTLGRIWYEMTRGATSLAQRCRYLVRRPNEVFLDPGQAALPQKRTENDPQPRIDTPVYIPHRTLKDPREIRLLDPACGSMHFGLYAFDLLEAIYEEAWDLSCTGKCLSAGNLKPLHQVYPSKAALLRDVPRLIIECNLHGIEIDPRALQIAGLSVCLRAQKSWQAQGLRPQERPSIGRSLLVCAEPMPGNTELLTNFTAQLKSAAVGHLVTKVFDKMRLAGEAGSLLMVEEEITTIVREAKREWQAGPKAEQGLLFPESARPKQELLQFDWTVVSDQQFWETAEQEIYEALQEYAESVDGVGGYRRRLFAADAARGFAFIDLCRLSYDVVVMNPPFGEPTLSTRAYIAERFPDAKEDIYAAFVARFAKKLDGGALGVISSRTGFFLAGSRRWREKTLLSPPGLSLFADLGDGVLDGALVEAAAYVITNSEAPCIFFRLLDQEEKGRPLLHWIEQLAQGATSNGTYLKQLDSFRDFPEARISYWAPESVREIYRTLPAASGSGLEVKFGLSTKDDFRFIRACWEVSPESLVSDQNDATRARPWMYLAKGGEYALHFGDIHLVVNWADRGSEIGASVIQRYPYLNGDANWVLHTEVPYGKPGVTYTKRTTSGFSPRLLPPGCLISDLGCTIFAPEDAQLPLVLAAYSSRAFGYLLEFNLASGDSVHSGSAARHYEIGTVAAVPIPKIDCLGTRIAADALSIWERKATIDAYNETSRYFLIPWPTCGTPIIDLSSLARSMRNVALDVFVEILEKAAEAEAEVRANYRFEKEAIEACEADFGPDVTSYSKSLMTDAEEAIRQDWVKPISDVIDSTAQVLGFSRFVSKMTFLADRRLELLCHKFKAHPRAVGKVIHSLPATPADLRELSDSVVSYAVGCVFGRWDIRRAMSKELAAAIPNPFQSIQPISPGMLRSAGIGHIGYIDSPDAYPLPISAAGILVDDPGHTDDVEDQVRAALHLIFGESADVIEAEACAQLGFKRLRDYFRKPSGFFADHLKRYSKSRRQAPIYLPLSTRSGNYTLWLYYPRLTSQTLHTVLADFLDPKIKDIAGEIRAVRAEQGPCQHLDDMLDFQQELEALRLEIDRVIKLPFVPSLDDGVLISVSPLWKLFRLPKWQKDLRACWEALERGEYDWAHLALSIRPCPVKEKCKVDRSFAIAHNLEEFCEVEPVSSARKPRKRRGGVQ